jgi:hypothetical protein
MSSLIMLSSRVSLNLLISSSIRRLISFVITATSFSLSPFNRETIAPDFEPRSKAARRALSRRLVIRTRNLTLRSLVAQKPANLVASNRLCDTAHSSRASRMQMISPASGSRHTVIKSLHKGSKRLARCPPFCYSGLPYFFKRWSLCSNILIEQSTQCIVCALVFLTSLEEKVTNSCVSSRNLGIDIDQIYR